MQLKCLLLTFSVITISHAIPVPKISSAETADDLRQLEFASENNRKHTVRNGRQGGGFFDYFSYPSEYSQPSYYPDYYGSYYDPYSYQPPSPPIQPPRRPTTINNSPIGYPSRRKYNQRRKNIEANTQRWTVWDLA